MFHTFLPVRGVTIRKQSKSLKKEDGEQNENNKLSERCKRVHQQQEEAQVEHRDTVW